MRKVTITYSCIFNIIIIRFHNQNKHELAYLEKDNEIEFFHFNQDKEDALNYVFSRNETACIHIKRSLEKRGFTCEIDYE